MANHRSKMQRSQQICKSQAHFHTHAPEKLPNACTLYLKMCKKLRHREIPGLIYNWYNFIMIFSYTVSRKNHCPHSSVRIRHCPHRSVRIRHCPHSSVRIRHCPHCFRWISYFPHCFRWISHCPHSSVRIRHCPHNSLRIRHCPHCFRWISHCPVPTLLYMNWPLPTLF